MEQSLHHLLRPYLHFASHSLLPSWPPRCVTGLISQQYNEEPRSLVTLRSCLLNQYKESTTGVPQKKGEQQLATDKKLSANPLDDSLSGWRSQEPAAVATVTLLQDRNLRLQLVQANLCLSVVWQSTAEASWAGATRRKERVPS